ncbi:MAG: tetratricopeptide repeat protein [Bacteroidota bacterium]
MKSLDYARQAYKLSLESKYLPGKALAKKNEGVIWFFIGKNDSAALCYKQALGIFTSIGDEKGESACYNNLGLIAQETGKYDEALTYYQSSIDIDHKSGDEIGVATTKGNIADIFMYQGKTKKALVITGECIEIFKRHENKIGLMSSYSTRASEYDYLVMYDKAILDYIEALKIAIDLNDTYQEIVTNSNIGVVYWHYGKPKIAMKYLNKALEMSDEVDDAYNIDNTLKTIAQIYTSQKEYIKANEILIKVLKRVEGIDNKRQVADIMTSMGRNLIELNEIDKALGYLNESLRITKKLDTPYELLENYRNLAYAYAILHEFKTADSIQDCFAQTYSVILSSDSASEIVGQSIVNQDDNLSDKSSIGKINNWIIAFLLFTIISIASVYAYLDKKKGE